MLIKKINIFGLLVLMMLMVSMNVNAYTFTNNIGVKTYTNNVNVSYSIWPENYQADFHISRAYSIDYSANSGTTYASHTIWYVDPNEPSFRFRGAAQGYIDHVDSINIIPISMGEFCSYVTLEHYSGGSWHYDNINALADGLSFDKYQASAGSTSWQDFNTVFSYFTPAINYFVGFPMSYLTMLYYKTITNLDGGASKASGISDAILACYENKVTSYPFIAGINDGRQQKAYQFGFDLHPSALVTNQLYRFKIQLDAYASANYLFSQAHHIGLYTHYIYFEPYQSGGGTPCPNCI